MADTSTFEEEWQ